MSKKYEDRFVTYWNRLFTDDAETRKEERALYIDINVLDNADMFPRAYRGTALFEKMNEQDDPVEEVYSRGRHTTRATRRKQTFHARNRAKEVCEIRKAKERKRWDDFYRHPWKPIKKQTHKRYNKVRVEESDLLPYDDGKPIEIDVPLDLYYLDQNKWSQEYSEYVNRIQIMKKIKEDFPVRTFMEARYGWR